MRKMVGMRRYFTPAKSGYAEANLASGWVEVLGRVENGDKKVSAIFKVRNLKNDVVVDAFADELD